MTRRRHTILVLIMLLMSQSIAVASTVCPMLLNGSNPSVEMTSMDHSKHVMADMQDDSSQSDVPSCCADNGCQMMGCVSAYLLSSMQPEPSAYNLFTAQEHYNPYVLRASPSSLFRPPII